MLSQYSRYPCRLSCSRNMNFWQKSFLSSANTIIRSFIAFLKRYDSKTVELLSKTCVWEAERSTEGRCVWDIKTILLLVIALCTESSNINNRAQTYRSAFLNLTHFTCVWGIASFFSITLWPCIYIELFLRICRLVANSIIFSSRYRLARLDQPESDTFGEVQGRTSTAISF